MTARQGGSRGSVVDVFRGHVTQRFRSIEGCVWGRGSGGRGVRVFADVGCIGFSWFQVWRGMTRGSRWGGAS